MNITDTNPITYTQRIKTDAINANQAMRIATPKELENYTLTKNFDRYVGVSAADVVSDVAGVDEKKPYEIIDPKKIYQPELSADMDDTQIKAAVGSLFSQIGSRDHHVPFDSSRDLSDFDDYYDAYYARLRLKQQVKDSGFNENNIADIAAKVGSEIDRYHDEGKISDEQYGRFNDEIKSAVKSFVEELTTIRVTIAEEKEDAYGYATYGFAYNSMRPQSMEEWELRRIELRQQIEKENPLDFNEFFAKIDQMRAKVTGIKSKSDESGSANIKK